MDSRGTPIRKGKGGILEIYPEADADTYDNYWEDVDSVLDDIAKNPEKVVASVHRLVAERSGNSYKQAARELAELREALGPEKGPDYVQAVAGKLHADNARRYALTAALRGEALLP